ncbi:MAG: hypothetical protein OQJ81_11495 [Melioribacteraceae bacterium]|nr:hypothetical protein [Melioribacteraceae bacterium]
MKQIFPEIEVDENTFQVEINISNLRIDKNKIGNEIGYKVGEIPNHFNEIIMEIIDNLPKMCEIYSGYTILNLLYEKKDSSGLTIGNQYFNMDRIVTSQLKKADKAAIFLCTIGSQMETWSKNLIKEGDSVKGYFVDLTASTIVEEVANLLHDNIGSKVNNYGSNITNRYSPGYCNWSVIEQQKLFSFLPKDFCNVKLSDTSLMSPIKSISGVIGIGENVKYAEYICDRCGIKDCTHRVYLQSKNA